MGTANFTETQQKRAVLTFIERHLITYGNADPERSVVVALDFGDVEKGIHRFRVKADKSVVQIK